MRQTAIEPRLNARNKNQNVRLNSENRHSQYAIAKFGKLSIPCYNPRTD